MVSSMVREYSHLHRAQAERENGKMAKE